MKILTFDQQDDLAIAKRSVAPLVHHVLHAEKCHADEVAIYFISVPEICRLHKEFFGDPSPTDCISFPYDDKKEGGYHLLGEIFVSPQAAVDFVLKKSEAINEECYRETSLYVVHGLLHLLGYDDIKDEERDEMRAAENRLMKQLIDKDLLLTA
ncbi:MAG: Endoribonuclease YbeY [Chlamydiales bacterium]|nr:Endoribonuclease YbeY [Chlamydiales bacterium]MCH9620089.1 Endoribonuclease YbeY [Chlamydiales bacterium]MCH9623042.1 Endoribonuclease YbeY [Chlamydiales bacterium]